MTDPERELRDALHARAGAMRVGRTDEPALVRRVGTARRRRRQARSAGVATALVLALGVASLVAADDPERSTVVAGPDPSSTTTFLDPSTSTLETLPEVVPTVPAPGPVTVVPEATLPAAPSTTAAPPRRTTTTAAPLPPVPDDAVWPAPGSSATFSAPDRAVDDFARRFLGMATPQLGAAKVAGDRATVDLRALPTAGKTTVVSLRRVDRRGWVVTSAAAVTITVTTPAAGATVASPLAVRGEAWTFEGNVSVEVRRDGATEPIGESFGTGGGDALRPFEATVTFAHPSVPRGTLVALEPRVDDASGPLVATVLRVAF